VAAADFANPTCVRAADSYSSVESQEFLPVAAESKKHSTCKLDGPSASMFSACRRGEAPAFKRACGSRAAVRPNPSGNREALGCAVNGTPCTMISLGALMVSPLAAITSIGGAFAVELFRG
jgi:hypothetical protein